MTCGICRCEKDSYNCVVYICHLLNAVVTVSADLTFFRTNQSVDENWAGTFIARILSLTITAYSLWPRCVVLLLHLTVPCGQGVVLLLHLTVPCGQGVLSYYYT